MPTITASSITPITPSPDLGGSAVTGAGTGGHSATTSSVTGIGLETKTCKWPSFPHNVQGQIVAVHVKFDWSRNGALGAGTSNIWTVQAGFGPDVGENEVVKTESNVSGASSGSVDHALSVSLLRRPGDLFVADSIGVVGAIGQSVSLTITISNLQLEVTYVGGQTMMVMM